MATSTTTQSETYGATIRGHEVDFRVWAPTPKQVTLRLLRAGRQPQDIPMRRDGEDFVATAEARVGDRYAYILDGSQPIPDPVSRFLPEGVHGPTEIVDPTLYAWSDERWRGLPLEDYVIYELHVGTFTPQGTFDSATEKLQYLKDLGVTVVEVMPVAATPGTRNWGYDGVSPYAVQANYGGPAAFRRFVDSAHELGLAVILDVVYNHLGPEGNYLRMFGPYFTAHHKTPWGDAINYDDKGCEQVRRYVVNNALYWIREYHLDGLRLDAVQTIKDDSPKHILAEIQENVQALAAELQRTVVVIAETDENDSRYIEPQPEGYGLNAVWSDDFHHALHALLTGERTGYYQDFGRPEQVAKALRDGYVFQGENFAFWNAPRGTPAKDVPLPANVICIQNHDQVGNRAKGERLDSTGSARRSQDGGGAAAARAAYAAAVHGAGVRRERAVSVLRRLRRSRAEESRQRRPPQRVQGLRFQRSSRSRRSADLRALEADVGRRCRKPRHAGRGIASCWSFGSSYVLGHERRADVTLRRWRADHAGSRGRADVANRSNAGAWRKVAGPFGFLGDGSFCTAMKTDMRCECRRVQR